MKILVTGGGGFLGQYVVRAFLERGAQVRVFSRGAYPELEALGVECQRGDLSDLEAVSLAVKGTQSVHHVAAQPGFWGPKSMYWRPNVIGTQNVIAACKMHGVKRLVFTSSPSVVFGDSPHDGADEDLPYPESYLCYYPKSKARAEQLVLQAHEPGKLQTVSLRPHLIWGPGDRHLIPRVVQMAQKRKLMRVGDGQNKVSVVYVENAASAHVCAEDALSNPDSPAGGKAYFIAQEEPVHLWQFIDEILDGLSIPKPSRSISYSRARRIGAVLEGVHRALFLPGEPRMTRFVAAQLGTSHWYRIDRAKKDIGYDPRISTEEGLRRLIADLKNPKS
jgi:2-alkyl-3-oxoalkanoate reductase